ncbi:beta-1,2-xylosyltransferase XYXT1-like isoform X1 [Musa acuminata AAA Group]|uniref:beta-1,2-xylosyltransferase XYXT1-like isoform X1 n=1 Tax=Musa acuminata AAA Group TaxID=214697 RepID=UPI0031D4CDA9
MRPSTAASTAGRMPQRLVFVAFMGCLLMIIPCFFVAVWKPKLDPLSSPNLQLSVTTSIKIQAVRESSSISDRSGSEMVVMPISVNEDEAELTNDTEIIRMPPPEEEKGRVNMTFTEAEFSNSTMDEEQKNNDNGIYPTTNVKDAAKPKQEFSLATGKPKAEEGTQEITSQTEGVAESKITCDLSERRSDTCVMHGDVRVLGYSSSIILSKAPQADAPGEENTWKIRPYARKWESPLMEIIRELTLKESTKPADTPRCAVHHTVPAIVFSTGGFLGNFFHDFTDVLIPLFTTARQYRGEAQFLVTNFNYGWIKKYEQILRRLSHYQIIDLDRDGRVHCFRHVHVGLLSHKELSMDPAKSPNGYSMADFREFLRSCFSLKRKSVSAGNRKPRLLMINRKGPRSFSNRREVASLARSLGYKVVVAGPEETKNLSRFARVVNSCDVMMGVHGAGLTNMLFLPTDAALVQVIPWGGLKYACGHDFGEPAPDMGIRYLEYEIKEGESSLMRQYPRSHPVFTDPLSIHKQGWNVLWSVFLNKQSVRLDVRRFKGVLQEAMNALPH